MVMYIITHKQFQAPKHLSAGYQPLLVGADFNANPAGYPTDNTGANISAKNPSFCELTGLYWFWKNASDEHVGLSHYRRYFSSAPTHGKLYLQTMLTGGAQPIAVEKLDQLLAGCDWITSIPEIGGEGSLTDQFNYYHNPADLEVTRQVIEELSPDVLPAFDQVMGQPAAAYFNMFYTRREELNAYCEWLFKILFEIEKRTDISSYDQYQARLYGFLGERLLNVWLAYKQSRVKHLAVFQTDQLNRAYVWDKIKGKLNR